MRRIVVMRCISLLIGLFPFAVHAELRVEQVTFSENELLLLDVRLGRNVIFGSLEAYPYQNRTLVAVEPLFDSLSLRYQLYNDKLIVWKDDDQYTLPFEPFITGNFLSDSNNGQAFWATDGFFIFLDTQTLAEFFNVGIEVNSYKLSMGIETDPEGYLFPVQRLAILENQRILAAAASTPERRVQPQLPITIDDEYQFITAPNGRINTSATWKEGDTEEYFSLQMVNDFLYHSADLTATKQSSEDEAIRLKMSRYKTRPDKLILGAFDQYSWGDVSGFSNNLTTDTSGGLGVTFEKAPENFRRGNLEITIEETAPPGWEAELFRNNQFIGLATVPANGLITFEDVPTEYGNNYFQIKLYSPYGEEEIIERYVDLSSNALSGGAIAYNLYGIDSNHRLINDQNRDERKVTDYGGTVDYGISDHWQIGFGYASKIDPLTDDEEQFYSVKNAFALPGLLLENDAAINQDNGYAQLTSLVGNSVGNQRYTLSYESAEDYKSAKINAENDPYSLASAAYSGSYRSLSYNFNVNYFDQADRNSWRVSNGLYSNIGKLYVSHVLNYYREKDVIPTGTNIFGQPITTQQVSEGVSGQLGLSGRLADQVRASGAILYAPEESSPILDGSSMLVEWSPRPFDIRNYLTFRYLPLTNASNNWQAGHRVVWDHRKFEFTLGSNYNADDEWSANAGMRFFLGYDYHNNRTIMRNNLSHQSATLDVHSYLDRHGNGVPDSLDYDLEGVEFTGSPEWEGLTSGESGKAILPGASANGPFYFSGRWKNGTQTVNNDYVVYTHPGALINVNMPFYLVSEIFGFVQVAGNDAPLSNAKILLKGEHLEREVTSDIDGYFEFLNLAPGEYEVTISQEYLDRKNYTSDIIGYRVSSPSNGGFVELDPFELQRKQDESDVLKEQVIPFTLDRTNSEAIVKEKDHRKRVQYFNLPQKQSLSAPHALAEDDATTQGNQIEFTPFVPPAEAAAQKGVAGQVGLPTVKFGGSKQAEPSIPREESTANVDASPEKEYTVQLAAFKDSEAAETYGENLKGIPSKAVVTKFGDYYRVSVGRFKSRLEADNFVSEHLNGKSAYIRAINP